MLSSRTVLSFLHVISRICAHNAAVDRLILLQYKRKRDSSDPASVKIEGEKTNDWFAVDLGM